MSGQACERAALVEALFDGRLGPAEQAATERHLHACAGCSELLRDLSSMRAQLMAAASPSSELERQRARLALLREGARPSVKKRRPQALLAAALTLLPLAAWAAISPQAPWRVTPPSPPPSAATRVHAPARSAPTAPALAIPEPAAPAPPTVEAPTAPKQRTARVAIGHKPAASEDSASQDFAGAMQSLSRGDFGAAANLLRAFAQAHPRDPRAEDALYLQAIALQRAGRLDEAKAAARSYIAAYPGGTHASLSQRIAGD